MNIFSTIHATWDSEEDLGTFTTLDAALQRGRERGATLGWTGDFVDHGEGHWRWDRALGDSLIVFEHELIGGDDLLQQQWEAGFFEGIRDELARHHVDDDRLEGEAS